MVRFRLLSPSGRGRVALLVSNTAPEKAPVGTVVYQPQTAMFKQMRPQADTGTLSWESIGAEPDLAAAVAEYGPDPGANIFTDPSLASDIEQVSPSPSLDLSYIVTPTTVYGTRPNALAIKSDGNLLHGNKNPSDGMIVSSNGEIELAIAGRYYQDRQIIAPTSDGTYNLNVAASTKTPKDWTLPFSIVLVNDTAGRGIIDLYDVVFTMKNNDTGASLTCVGSFDNGVFSLTNVEDSSFAFVDNTTNANGSVCQNIERFSFFPELLGPFTLGQLGAPIGNFSASLTATRKLGIYPSVIVKALFSVSDSTQASPQPESGTSTQDNESQNSDTDSNSEQNPVA